MAESKPSLTKTVVQQAEEYISNFPAEAMRNSEIGAVRAFASWLSGRAVEPTARAVVFREDCERCLSERDHGYPSCGYCGKEFVRLQSKSGESL